MNCLWPGHSVIPWHIVSKLLQYRTTRLVYFHPFSERQMEMNTIELNATKIIIFPYNYCYETGFNLKMLRLSFHRLRKHITSSSFLSRLPAIAFHDTHCRPYKLSLGYVADFGRRRLSWVAWERNVNERLYLSAPSTDTATQEGRDGK